MWARSDGSCDSLWEYHWCHGLVRIRSQNDDMTMFDCSLMSVSGETEFRCEGVYIKSIIGVDVSKDVDNKATLELVCSWVESPPMASKSPIPLVSLRHVLIKGEPSVCKAVKEKLKLHFCSDFSVDPKSMTSLNLSSDAVIEFISWIDDSSSDALEKIAEEFNTVDMTIVCPSTDVSADIRAWLLLLEKICALSSLFMVVIQCVDVMSGVNAVDEVGASHSVYNVVSGAVQSAKLEYIRVEMLVIEVAIVDVLYGAMKCLAKLSVGS